MCGIAGYVHLDGRAADSRALGPMLSTLKHRGPDGQGELVDGPSALGHRRLAIIDVDGGQQPMSTSEGRFAITFNGEIYNYVEIREELESLGARFRTASDTEVILRAYEHWGADCLQRLNGMWAFALWDTRERSLFVSRDRIGEKPLYYSVSGSTFVFASEPKALFAYGVERRRRYDVLELYLSLGYVPAPHTFYVGVHKLQPGHWIRVQGSSVLERRYWELPQVAESDMQRDASAVEARFRELLEDSVSLRMRADVPFGAFLSGGLDSASVVSLMSARSRLPVQTFTIGFEQSEFDERALARTVSERFHTTHHEQAVEPESYERTLARVVHHHDEPFGDSSAIPTDHVARHAARNVKMVLTGDGGDEVLSGYTSYQGEVFSAAFARIPSMLQHAIPVLASLLGRPLRGRARFVANRIARVTESAAMPFAARLARKHSFVDLATIKRMTQGVSTIAIEDFLADVLRKCSYQDPFYRLMYFHLSTALPDDMLTKVDRMTMASSLEARAPFLDHRLVELMATVDRRVKMPLFTRKAVLRNTIGKALPAPLRRAKKRGFVVPVREWFRDRELEPQRAELRSLEHTVGIPSNEIERAVAANLTGREDLGNFLWMLAVLARWARD